VCRRRCHLYFRELNQKFAAVQENNFDRELQKQLIITLFNESRQLLFQLYEELANKFGLSVVPLDGYEINSTDISFLLNAECQQNSNEESLKPIPETADRCLWQFPLFILNPRKKKRSNSHSQGKFHITNTMQTDEDGNMYLRVRDINK